MSAVLEVLSCGPQVAVQDTGRPGWIARGLSRGGAADVLALAEAEALLGRSGAALEMAGFGGRFTVDAPMRVALTGAPMKAARDGEPLAWPGCHGLVPGQVLEIGAVRAGVYGYLSFGGGLAVRREMGSQSVHMVARIGAVLKAGDRVPLGQDPGGVVGLSLPVPDRFAGGDIRVVASAQTALFDEEALALLETAEWRRAARGNRQGVALDVTKIRGAGGLNLISETIAPGDIQVTGDGTPFVLLAECQTTGGYPRIATVIPPDVPRVAQAGAGAALRIVRVSEADGLAALRGEAARLEGLRQTVVPLLRDPAAMRDLLSYSLISGVTSGREE